MQNVIKPEISQSLILSHVTTELVKTLDFLKFFHLRNKAAYNSSAKNCTNSDIYWICSNSQNLLIAWKPFIGSRSF